MHGLTLNNRIIAFILAAIVVCTMLFAVGFLVFESDHGCSGDDCPVCFRINVCSNILKSFRLISFSAAVFVFLGFLLIFQSVFVKNRLSHISLVSLNVKLSE